MNINAEIRTEKRALNRHVANVKRILSKDPQAKQQFDFIMKKHKNRGHYMGATTTQVADDTSWWETDFVTDLFDLGVNAASSHLISKDETDRLNVELQQIEAKNRSLDKQITLQRTLGQQAGAYGGSFMDELLNSPIKLAALAGLGYYFFMQKKPKRRR